VVENANVTTPVFAITLIGHLIVTVSDVLLVLTNPPMLLLTLTALDVVHVTAMDLVLVKEDLNHVHLKPANVKFVKVFLPFAVDTVNANVMVHVLVNLVGPTPLEVPQPALAKLNVQTTAVAMENVNVVFVFAMLDLLNNLIAHVLILAPTVLLLKFVVAMVFVPVPQASLVRNVIKKLIAQQRLTVKLVWTQKIADGVLKPMFVRISSIYLLVPLMMIS